MKKYLVHNGNLICRPNNEYVYRNYTPNIPSDTKFIYLANNFDGDKIPNSVPDSTLGDFLRNGTLTKVGNGENCYIDNGNNKNFLYVEMSEEDLTLMKAVNNTFTYYFRFIAGSSNTGGVICWRDKSSYGGGDGYVYMFRSNNYKLQFHDNAGHDTDLYLINDTIYKATVSGKDVYIVDLNDTTKSFTYNNAFNRNMNRKMTTFWAGYGNEYVPNSKFYGMAGIARTTTSEEDTLMKNILMNQSV